MSSKLKSKLRSISSKMEDLTNELDTVAYELREDSRHVDEHFGTNQIVTPQGDICWSAGNLQLEYIMLALQKQLETKSVQQVLNMLEP